MKPAFHVSGTVTAGNSSQMSDGASALLLTSEAFAKDRGLTPLARFVAFATAGVAPERFGTGPVPAIQKALKLAGLSLQDIDLIELNEAFAAQVLACLRELPMDESRLNVNGGAIALGHPLGCTGAKLTTSIIYEMKRAKRALRPCDDVRGRWDGRCRHSREGRMTTASVLKGGAWLLEPGDPTSVLTPERLSNEHRLIGQTAQEFVNKEVVPQVDRLEQKDWVLARQLLHRCGELGLLGVDAPEEFGGVGLDKTAALVVSRNLSGSASFSAAFGAHGNLAITPILLFGTPEQKTNTSQN